MFYIDRLCTICQSGAIGFRLCSNGTTLVMMCDECNAVWLNAYAVSAKSAVFPVSPNYDIEDLQCSVASTEGSRWATLEEINSAGLGTLVAGEGDSISD